MHICLLTADYIVKPVLCGHSKKKTNYRLMQVKSIAECSKGSIMQPFWLSLSYHLLLRSLFCLFFEWLLKTCFTVLTTYMYFLFCGVHRLAVRWIFLLKWDIFTTKKDGFHWKWWAIFWNNGTMTRVHHKSEGLCTHYGLIRACTLIHVIGPQQEKTCFGGLQTTHANQPVLPRSVISAFIIHYWKVSHLNLLWV